MIDKYLEEILNNFHRATDLNLYVFKNQYDQIRKYTSPLAPNFPLSLLKESDNTSNKLNLILFNNQCAMGFFNIKDLKIIGLNLNFTIANNKNYDRLAPLLGWNKFSQTMKCLYFMIFNNWPIITKSSETFPLGENISLDNKKKASYKGYLIETELMKSVSKGNLDEYNDNFKKFVKYGNLGTFGDNKLRNSKDMAIAATTLCTRAAVKGGVPVSEAFGLSDEIIKQIEKDTVISNYYEYSRAIGEIFVARVNRVKRNNITSIVYRAQEYIFSNLTSIKNISEIAAELNVSTSYLQHLFKKEKNSSLVTYMNQEKVNLAVHELIFTNKKVGEIAYNAGFSSTSLFSTTFKRFKGLSPLKYRKKFK